MPSREEIERAARERFGEPNPYLSSKNELRFNRRGSIGVDLTTGAYFNHETQEGGYLIPNSHAAGPAIEPWWITVGKYKYLDLDGTINREVHKQLKGGARRFQQFYEENGERVYKVKDRKPIPYRLADWHDSPVVVLVEGEKDADNLAKLGIPATCRAGGSGKFEDDLVPYFKGKTVYIVPDNDRPGIDYAEKARQALSRAAIVKVAHLCKDMPAKADVSDWLEEQGQIDGEAVWSAIEAAPGIDGPPPEEDAPEGVPEAPAALLPLMTWNEVKVDTQTRDFVEDLLEDGAMSVVYGASNVGKTFVAMDLCAHVALGWKWRGRDVEQGPVVYLVMEGKAGITKRVEAFRRHHDVLGAAPFYIVPTAVNFFDSEADMQALINTIGHVEAVEGQPVRMVVVDTLARAAAGANENSGEDMGVVIKNCDRVREDTGAHLMVIHHSGKDTARGARGWSGVRAATDTEIEVTGVDGVGTITVTKQRELEQVGDMHFRLLPVAIGTNQRGKDISSCVVLESATAPNSKRSLSDEARWTREALVEAVATAIAKGTEMRTESGHPAVNLKAVMDEYDALEHPKCTEDTFRKRISHLNDVGMVGKFRVGKEMYYYSMGYE